MKIMVAEDRWQKTDWVHKKYITRWVNDDRHHGWCSKLPIPHGVVSSHDLQ